MKTHHLPAKGLLVLTLLISLAMPSMANEGKNTFSAAERKRMSTFLTNFTEVNLMNFTAAEAESEAAWKSPAFRHPAQRSQ